MTNPRDRALLARCFVVWLLAAGAPVKTHAQAGAEEALRQRIQALEQRLSELESRQAGAGAAAALPSEAAQAKPSQQLIERLDALEKRLTDLESSAVLTEPETRVRRVEVWVDRNGIEYDEPVAGANKTVTYRRERLIRRQTINEKIEEALADADSSRVAVNVDASTVVQGALQTDGANADPDGNSYQFASADLFFTAELAQYTTFFADVVGVSGSPPDSEIPTLTLLNSYTARLIERNELNLREAWLRTELFDQKLALSFGRLDLTNYFDGNTAANDETTQFISDALVNNPMLGLSSNGSGIAAVFDPKTGINFKVGLQQSDPDATNLSDSIFSLAEVGYFARPFSLPEGNYRAWFRTDNSSGERRTAYGVSLDQKLSPNITLFARYGSAEADVDRDHFYSGGLQFQNVAVLNPLDVWGIGYAQTELGTRERERLAEAYYNLRLADRLRLSAHLQYVLESNAGETVFGYLLPGLRLQGSF